MAKSGSKAAKKVAAKKGAAKKAPAKKGAAKKVAAKKAAGNKQHKTTAAKTGTAVKPTGATAPAKPAPARSGVAAGTDHKTGKRGAEPGDVRARPPLQVPAAEQPRASTPNPVAAATVSSAKPSIAAAPPPRSPATPAAPPKESPAPQAHAEPLAPAGDQAPAAAEPQTSGPGQAQLSPEEKKRLAAEHLRALLEEKKRRATQTPAWRRIEHRDHPAPRGEAGGEAPQDTPAGPPGVTRPRGDRGGG